MRDLGFAEGGDDPLRGFGDAEAGEGVDVDYFLGEEPGEEAFLGDEGDDESEEDDQPGAEAEVAEAVDDEESDIDSDVKNLTIRFDLFPSDSVAILINSPTKLR